MWSQMPGLHSPVWMNSGLGMCVYRNFFIHALSGDTFAIVKNTAASTGVQMLL